MANKNCVLTIFMVIILLQQNLSAIVASWPVGIGVILKSPKGDKLKYVARLQYQNTNNEAKYEALLKGLKLAKSLGAESVIVHGDSQFIINQVNGMCEVKESQMKKYLNKVRQLVKKFKKASFVQLLREENIEADALEIGRAHV